MHPTSTPARGLAILAFASIYLIWGSTYLAIRFAIETLPPFLMAATRFLVAGAILVVWRRLSGVPRPSWIQWRSAALVGAALLLGGNGGVVWAETRIDSGLAALVVAMVPIWVVFLDWLRPGGSRPTRPVLLGILGGMAGIAILVGPAELAGTSRVDLLGVSVLVVASLSWSAGSLYARSAPLPPQPLLATGMEMLAGGGLLLVAGLVAGEGAELQLREISLRSALSLAYLIVFGAILAYSAYAWLLRHVETAKVATYAYVNPVVALVLGWALAGEELSPRALLAALVILASVVLITTQRRTRIPPPADLQPPLPADAGPGPEGTPGDRF